MESLLASSTPVPSAPETQDLENVDPEVENIACDTQPGPSRKTVTRGKGKGKGKGKSKKDTHVTVADYDCIMCGEEYIEPPIEEWVKCSQCNGWCHVKCSAFDETVSLDFICDWCQELNA